MASVYETSVQEADREAVLGLQELPEYGGAQPDVLGMTSFVSVWNDCSSLYGSTTCQTTSMSFDGERKSGTWNQ